MERDFRAVLTEVCAQFCESSDNFVPADRALRPDLAGLRLFDAPLLAVADAGDPLFLQMRRPEVVGPHFVLPEEWLPGARAVISFFLPLTKRIAAANRDTPVETPPEWLHGRIDGQRAVGILSGLLCGALRDAGYPGVAPSLDARFWSSTTPATRLAGGETHPGFTSCWSERHVAYVCGLGTFGLHRGLITARGTAGRFGSVVTTLPITPDARPYAAHDEYCTRCGACIPKCPVGAISLRDGKNQVLCGAHLDATVVKYAPYYGCGKCNVGVPCQAGIPRGGGAAQSGV